MTSPSRCPAASSCSIVGAHRCRRIDGDRAPVRSRARRARCGSTGSRARSRRPGCAGIEQGEEREREPRRRTGDDQDAVLVDVDVAGGQPGTQAMEPGGVRVAERAVERPAHGLGGDAGKRRRRLTDLQMEDRGAPPLRVRSPPGPSPWRGTEAWRRPGAQRRSPLDCASRPACRAGSGTSRQVGGGSVGGSRLSRAGRARRR